MPHQAEILKSVKHHHRIALFLEMRLGKTLVAIRWAKQFPGRRLVVAPLSVLPVWTEELRKEGETSVILRGPKRWDTFQLQKDTSQRWFLINYEALLHAPLLAGYFWETIILDESTKIKNPKAKISQVLTRDDTYRCNQRAILSGLPNPESLLDFFMQFKFLRGEFLGHHNFWGCRDHMFFQEYGGYNWVPKPGTRKRIAKELKSADVFQLSRKQVGLANRRITERRIIPLPPKCRALYDQTENEWSVGNTDLKFTVAKHAWLCAIASGRNADKVYEWGHKLKELLYLLRSELKWQQVVVWFMRTAEGKLIEKSLRDKGHTVARIAGATELSKRANIIHQFHSGEFQVLCMQQHCGRYGVDLSCASAAIYYSLSPSSEAYHQSMDRIAHPKKKEPLLFVYLLGENTVDVDTLDALGVKRMRSQFLMLDAIRMRMAMRRQ